MTFGLDTVVARGRNVSVNGVVVPEGQPHLHGGEGQLGSPVPMRHRCWGPGALWHEVLQGDSASSGGPRAAEPHRVPSSSLCPADPDFVPAGISITWLGDFVAVESGLGVRVKADGRGTSYVTVSAELWGSTRGLCGPYNDDPTGKAGPSLAPCMAQQWQSQGWPCRGRVVHPWHPLPADDFLRVGGDVAPFAASFGNSWRIPDASSEVPGLGRAGKWSGCGRAERGTVPSTQLGSLGLSPQPHSQQRGAGGSLVGLPPL